MHNVDISVARVKCMNTFDWLDLFCKVLSVKGDWRKHFDVETCSKFERLAKVVAKLQGLDEALKNITKLLNLPKMCAIATSGILKGLI